MVLGGTAERRRGWDGGPGAAASGCVWAGEEKGSVGWVVVVWGVRVSAGRTGGEIFFVKGRCQLPYGHSYLSVADLLKLGSLGFDYVRFGHVVSRRQLSLAALFGYPGAILCIRVCLQCSIGCAYSIFPSCLAPRNCHVL